MYQTRFLWLFITICMRLFRSSVCDIKSKLLYVVVNTFRTHFLLLVLVYREYICNLFDLDQEEI
jgi:hypothetical protein